MTWAFLWTQHSPPQLMSWLPPIKLGNFVLFKKDHWPAWQMRLWYLLTVLWRDQISNLKIKANGYKPPGKNTKGSNKVNEGPKMPHLWRTTLSPKITVPAKRKAKNSFDSDTQNTLQSYKSGSNSFVQRRQKVRAKEINSTVFFQPEEPTEYKS